MTCPQCHDTGFYIAPSPHDYRPGTDAHRQCDCRPADPWRPAKSLNQIDDEIAAKRAAERETANADQ